MDTWYTSRTPEGIALIGTVFYLEYECCAPVTKEMHDFSEKYLTPAVEVMVQDIEQILR